MNKHTSSVSLIDGHTEDRTDAEIMKALEICNSTKKGHCLNRCPYYNYSANCMQSMINDALDLIKRQQEEIKDLQKIVAGKQKMIDELSQIITDTCEDCKVKLDANKVRVEAIKEFAEGLKDSWYTVNDYDDIDNLVKEMTEVKKIENTESN